MCLYHCCQLYWNCICLYSAVSLLHSSTEHAMCIHSVRMHKRNEGLAGDLLIVEGVWADFLVSFSFSASFAGVFWGRGSLNASEKQGWGFVQSLYGYNIFEILWCSHHSPSYPAKSASWITSLYPISPARGAPPRKQPASAQLASWLVSSTKNDCVEISGNHCLGLQGKLLWLL